MRVFLIKKNSKKQYIPFIKKSPDAQTQSRHCSNFVVNGENTIRGVNILPIMKLHSSSFPKIVFNFTLKINFMFFQNYYEKHFR